MDCYRGTRPYPEQRIENHTVRLFGSQGMSGTDEAVFNEQSEKPVVVDGADDMSIHMSIVDTVVVDS